MLHRRVTFGVCGRFLVSGKQLSTVALSQLILLVVTCQVVSGVEDNPAGMDLLIKLVVAPERFDVGNDCFSFLLLGGLITKEVGATATVPSVKTLLDPADKAVEAGPEWQKQLASITRDLCRKALKGFWIKCDNCKGKGSVPSKRMDYLLNPRGSLTLPCPICDGQKGKWQQAGVTRHDLTEYASAVKKLMADHSYSELPESLLVLLLASRGLYVDYVNFPEFDKEPEKFTDARVWFFGQVSDIHTKDGMTAATVLVTPQFKRLQDPVQEWKDEVVVSFKGKTTAVKGSLCLVFGRFKKSDGKVVVEADTMGGSDRLGSLKLNK